MKQMQGGICCMIQAPYLQFVCSGLTKPTQEGLLETSRAVPPLQPDTCQGQDCKKTTTITREGMGETKRR